MKRVIVVHPRLVPHGGGQALGAWALQALRDRCALSLLTWSELDYSGLNLRFGTNLRAGDFRVISCPRWIKFAADLLPGTGSILTTSLLLRHLKRLDRTEAYDVILSTHDEMDFGRRGIQYIHNPHGYRLPETRHLRWYQFPPGMLALYRGLCQRLSPVTREGLRRNLTLVNSRYIASRVAQVHGIPSVVVHPPAAGSFPVVPWEDRAEGFVCVGRLTPVKQFTDAVHIIEALRARGHRLSLHIIGTPEHSHYEKHLRDLAESRREWMNLHVDLPRVEMIRLISQQRYGLHPQVGEHFGMAVAELVRAGCLTFVARPGGPVEIVGERPELAFGSPDEAVESIHHVLRNRSLAVSLQRHLKSRAELFTPERFAHEIWRAVDEFGDAR